MKANRARDTKPELAVRKLLHGSGLRYRISARPLPTLRSTADILFPRAKIAVYIDGCFWHGCQLHHTISKSNSEYWATKVVGNRERDLRITEALTDAGWTVLRFWEHEDPVDISGTVFAKVILVAPSAK